MVGHGQWFLQSLKPLEFRSEHQRSEGTAEEILIAYRSRCDPQVAPNHTPDAVTLEGC